MDDYQIPPCEKCGGRQKADTWRLDEHDQYEKREEVYFTCITCGKVISPGIILNRMDPDRIRLDDRAKRIENRPVDLEDFQF